MKEKFWLVAFAVLLLSSCATTPQKAATDALFITGKGVNDAYSAYLDGIFAKPPTIKTNSFPKVSRDYSTFQQLFALAVSELPGTNGIPAALSTGTQVLADISLAKKGVLP